MGSTSISYFFRLTVTEVISPATLPSYHLCVQYRFTIEPITICYRYGTAATPVLVTLGEEQHYGRAEKRLRVAQPALSRQIKNLEEDIGFKLFERLPRGVKITAAGEFLLEEARRILQEVNDATASAKRIASGQSGTLRIGFVESISWHGIIPDSLTDFRKKPT